KHIHVSGVWDKHQRNEVFWMAMQEKLMTQDKYAKKVWDELQVLMKKECNADWKRIILEFSKLPSNKKIWSIIRKLVCQAAVYYIWHERNGRIFRNKMRDEAELIKTIRDAIKMNLMSMKTKDIVAVRQVKIRWSIVFKKL
ncbi:hypothetical protein Tco_0036132, partial [Tanacetum coccineum]